MTCPPPTVRPGSDRVGPAGLARVRVRKCGSCRLGKIRHRRYPSPRVGALPFWAVDVMCRWEAPVLGRPTRAEYPLPRQFPLARMRRAEAEGEKLAEQSATTR